MIKARLGFGDLVLIFKVTAEIEQFWWGASVFNVFNRKWMIWPQGYKTVFMLNSSEHETYPAHKC